MLIYGSEESVIEDVSFDNVTFELTDSKLNDVAGGNVDLRGALYEKDQLFQRVIPGLLIHYANNISINRFKLVWSGTRMPYFTHGIEANHFKGLSITDFRGGASPLNSKASRIYVDSLKGFVTDNILGVVVGK